MDAHQSPQLNAEALTMLINSLQTPAFSSALIRWLNSLCQFDCAVILGYSETRRPVYLFDNISFQRELLFTQYINGQYQQDPFYQRLQNGLAPGVYSLAELTENHGFPPDYLHDFYDETGWKHELGIMVKIDYVRWIVIFIGFITSEYEPVRAVKNQLNRMYALLASLCCKHWQSDPFLLAQTPVNQPDMRALITKGMNSFLQERLTTREQAICQLILQGMNSVQIATHCGITPGTVKNHRKHIFAKLHIESQANLFGMFLDHLITS